MQRYYIALVLSLAALVGCEGYSRHTDTPPDFTAYGELPGLAKSGDPALQDELARLQAEQATPAQLDAAVVGMPDDENGAVAMRSVLSAEKVMRANNDVNDIYPVGKFAWSAGGLERARDLLKYHRKSLEAMRAAIARPHCDFQIKYASGLLADTSLVPTYQLAHRWEALDAAVLLSEGQWPAAAECVQRMLQIDQQLAQQHHVMPRLKGAALRLEALQVLEAVVQHPQAQGAMLAQLRDLLLEQLAQWPADSAVWNADRAIGLHAYEMIRHGYLLSILTNEELTDLRQKAGVSATAQGVQTNIDNDERFYLETMRSSLAACDQPYYERRETITALQTRLRDSEQTPQYPLVAATILLVDFDEGQRRLAQERAACEGWAIALATATGQAAPPFQMNPLTGEPYQQQQEATRVLVSQAIDQTIIVPRLQIK